jgi:hypothetical protein
MRQYGIAVRLCLRYEAAPDRASGARPVLHDDVLPELRSELLDDHARNDIGRAARTDRDDQAQRARGPFEGPAVGSLKRYHRTGNQSWDVRSHGHCRSFLCCGAGLRPTVQALFAPAERRVQYRMMLVAHADPA